MSYSHPSFGSRFGDNTIIISVSNPLFHTYYIYIKCCLMELNVAKSMQSNQTANGTSTIATFETICE